MESLEGARCSLAVADAMRAAGEEVIKKENVGPARMATMLTAITVLASDLVCEQVRRKLGDELDTSDERRIVPEVVAVGMVFAQHIINGTLANLGLDATAGVVNAGEVNAQRKH
jgi:hypothetical protein